MGLMTVINLLFTRVGLVKIMIAVTLVIGCKKVVQRAAIDFAITRKILVLGKWNCWWSW
jgi:hypothetical protein